MEKQKPQIIPQEQAPESVSDVSPFNGVKLELGFAIIIGIILWLVVDNITPVLGKQLILLAGYGLIAAIRLVTRTRQVVKRHYSNIN